MIPKEYWKQTDTPMENSLMGKMMQRVHELDPELSIEKAYERARLLLDRVAGSKHYATKVLSLKKEVEALAGLRERFKNSK